MVVLKIGPFFTNLSIESIYLSLELRENGLIFKTCLLYSGRLLKITRVKSLKTNAHNNSMDITMPWPQFGDKNFIGTEEYGSDTSPVFFTKNSFAEVNIGIT